MEVGAVKQSFNNEVILLKKKLNQARTQIIHKLTRKAKTFVEKKGSEELKEKFKRKAEAAVNEVLILKKIKAKDIAKFTVIHKGNLIDYINKPQVDQDKACARLLLHKALQDKYQLLRTRFANMPIEDLFMSRLERKKLKKEAKDKKKNKKGKENLSGHDWQISDVTVKNRKQLSDNDSQLLMDESEELDDNEKQSSDMESEVSDVNIDETEVTTVNADYEKSNDSNNKHESDIEDNTAGKFVRLSKVPKTKLKNIEIDNNDAENNKKPIFGDQKESKPPRNKVKNNDKAKNKSKNLNDKINFRKFKKSEVIAVQENKVVDPFFITATGENYMSVVEPRPPDEFKEIHKQGNRKLRRAAIFGHTPKLKPSQNSEFHFENSHKKTNYRFEHVENSNEKTNDKGNNLNKKIKGNQDSLEVEKLHPSWEAKKKQSTILPFQGKKVVFDDG